MTALSSSSLGRRVVVFLLLLLALGSSAEANVYPIEAIKPGLRGTAKTVIRGTEIESFEVEFLGVMRDAGPVGDLILIRVSGDVIDRSGGIAAGMSGSPVYINGQLVGAIAYGYSMSDHRIGFVTPINDMMEVLHMLADEQSDVMAPPAGDHMTPLQGTVGYGAPIREVILASTMAEAEALAVDAAPDTLVFAPVRAPLLASGLSSRAFSRLGERLASFEIVPVQAGGDMPVDVEEEPAALEPGSAFGVQLARGDVSLTSIGTVTYVEDDRFIGFGHSFMDRGAIDYVTSTAYIHHVVQSLSNPFKLGSVVRPVGSLLQDRGAGVAGRIGEEPRMIPVNVSVHDRDRDMSRTTSFEIVADDTFIVDLATTGALAALDRSLDRLGRGTARVVFRIEGEGMPRPLVRDNLYYSDRDIAALTLLEFVEAVSLVVHNRFSPVDVTGIQLSAQIEQERWTAHIESAAPRTEQVHPGDTVEIEVQLRPYRREPIRDVISLTIPEDAMPGFVTVEVRGGGWGLRPPSTDDDAIVDDPEEVLGIVDDLERLIDEFVRRERNNEIVAEFFGRRDTRRPQTVEVDDEVVRSDEDAAIEDELSEDDTVAASAGDGWFERHPAGGWVVATRSTPYVVLGSQFFDLYIAPRVDEAAEPSRDEPVPTQVPLSDDV